MNLTAQISDNDVVTLNVRPTVTRIIDDVQGPQSVAARHADHALDREPDPRDADARDGKHAARRERPDGHPRRPHASTASWARATACPIASRIPVLGDLVSYRNDTAEKTRARDLPAAAGRCRNASVDARPLRLPPAPARPRCSSRTRERRFPSSRKACAASSAAKLPRDDAQSGRCPSARAGEQPMSLLLDALKRAEQEKLARQGAGAARREQRRRDRAPAARGDPPSPRRAASSSSSPTSRRPAATRGERERDGAKTVFAAKQADAAPVRARAAKAQGRPRRSSSAPWCSSAAGGAYVWYQIKRRRPAGRARAACR